MQMIPSATAERVIDDTFEGESQSFTVDPEDLNFIMSLLTDLYGDRVKAIIREYATNALDAHIEAGIDRPIEITLPTRDDRNYTIRDFGVGIPAQNLLSVFGFYGRSRKRESTNVVGSFGLGSKSALAYTQQFVVTSVYNGKKSMAVITKDPEGVGGLKTVAVENTTEPNGTTVKIPVQEINDFARKSYEFFKFWKPGTVLINGAEPEHLAGDLLDENVDSGIIDIRLLAYDIYNYVVMGNVAYPVENTFSSYSWVANVAIRSVSIPPNRESLLTDSKTNAVVHKINKIVKARVVERATADIAQAKTHREAFEAMNRWKARLHELVYDVKYKGKSFPYRSAPNGAALYIDFKPGASRYAVSTGCGQYYYESIYKGLVISGYKPTGSVSSTHKAKIRQYLRDNDLGLNGSVFLFDTLPNDEWLDGANIVPWSVIGQIKLNPSSSGGNYNSKLIPGSYELWDDNQYSRGWRESHDALDSSKNIWYCGAGDMTQRGDYYCSYIPDGDIYVRVTANRLDKFNRTFPNAKHVRTLLVKMVEDFDKSITEEQKVWLNYHDSMLVKVLKGHKILDPEIANLLTIATKDYNKFLAEYRKICDIGSHAGKRPAGAQKVTAIDKAIASYPLINRGFSYYNRGGHIAEYVNSVWTCRQASTVV